MKKLSLIIAASAMLLAPLVYAQTLDELARIDHVLISHSHLDHVLSIPLLADSVIRLRQGPGGLSELRPIHVYALPETLEALRAHIFNGVIWPDFTRLPNHLLPVIRFHELQDEVPVVIGEVGGAGGVRFTPIPVNHVVPTYGFLIENGNSSFLWSSDTGPTQRLWETPRT